jgi:hypothetical protein
VVLACTTDGHHPGYLLLLWVSHYVGAELPPYLALFNSLKGGDRFTDRIDQEALLDVLVKTEKDHARPTASIQLQMKESWGWTSDDLS